MVIALRFKTLAAERLDDLDWGGIDGSWLAVVYGQPI
jgi:hypothetical protein